MVPARSAGIGHGAKDGHRCKDTQRRLSLSSFSLLICTVGIKTVISNARIFIHCHPTIIVLIFFLLDSFGQEAWLCNMNN